MIANRYLEPFGLGPHLDPYGSAVRAVLNRVIHQVDEHLFQEPRVRIDHRLRRCVQPQRVPAGPRLRAFDDRPGQSDDVGRLAVELQSAGLQTCEVH
jgi:hypothetical protein